MVSSKCSPAHPNNAIAPLLPNKLNIQQIKSTTNILLILLFNRKNVFKYQSASKEN